MPSVYLSPSSQEHNVGVDGIAEENRMHALAQVIAKDLRAHNITVWIADPAWTLSMIIADSNLRKPDLHVALHSNAGGGTGIETWCWGTSGTQSAEFGRKLQSAVVDVLGLPNRGVKDGTAHGNKLGEIVNVYATSVLIELFFHDNADDIQRYNERASLVASAITKTILDWFGVRLQTPPAKTQPAGVLSGAPQVKITFGDKNITGFIVNGRTYVSVRDLAEILGKIVTWDNVKKAVIIND